MAEPGSVKSVSASGEPSVSQVVATYRSLKGMTKEPVLVDRALAMSCRGATEAEVVESRKKSGPHAHTAVMIYMNELAAGVFEKAGAEYPVGAVIVKEKRGMNYWSSTQPQARKVHDGVGGMIKRPEGFDPAHGDWEYFYFEDPSRVESGRISSCVQCHSGAVNSDYVFGDWARKR